MADWNPKSLWKSLLESVFGQPGEDRKDRALDPDLVFHLAFTAPMVIGVLLSLRRR